VAAPGVGEDERAPAGNEPLLVKNTANRREDIDVPVRSRDLQVRLLPSAPTFPHLDPHSHEIDTLPREGYLF
jgi:hypothetical protein